MALDPEYEPEDLQFLSPRERLIALGMDPEVDITYSDDPHPGDLKGRDVGPVHPAIKTLQPPLPGWLEIRVAEVARARGLVNPRGPYRGKVSLTALTNGTNLAHTTIKPMIATPEECLMFHQNTLIRLCDFLRCQPGDLMIYHKGRRPSGR